jgi:hypothetical protein
MEEVIMDGITVMEMAIIIIIHMPKEDAVPPIQAELQVQETETGLIMWEEEEVLLQLELEVILLQLQEAKHRQEIQISTPLETIQHETIIAT